MDYFHYHTDQLYAESCAVEAIAHAVDTPCYIYSRATLERHYLAYANALKKNSALICYAVKANSNLAVLNVLAALGSGFDIVSGGELKRVLLAGGNPKKVVFSGVGKSEEEIRFALKTGIFCFNVESHAELLLIEQISLQEKIPAPISIRVNPEVDAQTHPYISTGLKENKFGVPACEAISLYQHANQSSALQIKGIDCHIGSQLTELPPVIEAFRRLLQLVKTLESQGIQIEHIDVGGGLGVTYQSEKPPHPTEYTKALVEELGDLPYQLILEPGRAIAANAGILVTEVQLLKSNADKNFAIVDAAMNDLLRPALYQAWQDIIPVDRAKKLASPVTLYDIVGPVCESGDFLGKDRALALNAKDLLAVRSAGAYGYVMASNYNSRNRPAEVMVDGDQYYIIRRRETFDDLVRGETLIPQKQA